MGNIQNVPFAHVVLRHCTKQNNNNVFLSNYRRKPRNNLAIVHPRMIYNNTDFGDYAIMRVNAHDVTRTNSLV